MNAKELCDWFAGPSPISEMDAEDKHTILRALRLLAAIEDESGPTPEADAVWSRLDMARHAFGISTRAELYEHCRNAICRLEQERNAALRALEQAKEE